MTGKTQVLADDDRYARLILSLTFEPGDPRVGDLIARVGAVEGLAMVQSNLTSGSADHRQRMRDLKPDRVLEHAAHAGIRFVVPGDEEWPQGLDDLARGGSLSQRGGVPVGLWVKGRPLHQIPRLVAIVGSRAATTYGAQVAALIASELTTEGWGVISGGAYGIDIAAHHAVLASGGVMVVALAHGLDRAYPVGNSAAIEATCERGALVSELAPGAAPTKLRFLSRNRLIAALACGTVIVEAGMRSGALNTANWTTKLCRPLLAVPGPITSAASFGPNQLIRSGAAVLTTTGGEVLEMVDAVGQTVVEIQRAAPRPTDGLTVRHRQLLDAVPFSRPALLEKIAVVAGITLGDAADLIEELAELRLVVNDDDRWRLKASETGEP